MKKIKLTQGKYTYVSNKDFSELNKFKWYTLKRIKTWYAVRNYKTENGEKRIMLMHRHIMNTPKNMVTDHIDHDGLNNQRNNLRICSSVENSRNQNKHIDNISGYKGVTFLKKSNKWMARIYVNKKNIYLGMYQNKKLAYQSYVKASKKYHKEFAWY